MNISKYKNNILKLIYFISLFLCAPTVSAFKFPDNWSLDSIAARGKFPKFCVDTYRWGDKFFNGYDSLYVAGTGYKFNAKATSEMWADSYTFNFGNNTSISMLPLPSVSMGLHLTYLAVSVGYDLNLNKFFNGYESARRRWNFQFNCMLFAADLNFISDHGGTRIRRFTTNGKTTYPHLKFDGVDNTQWGIDLYYFFNHKKYSQAAAFNFSRIQLQNGGSFFAGLSYKQQNYKFDFNSLPDYMKSKIPLESTDYHYTSKTRSYFVKGGYGYNWVFHPRWVLGVSESPMAGIAKGYLNETAKEETRFQLYNMARLSVVYNNKEWFIGAIGNLETSLINNNRRILMTNVMSLMISGGYRFNLW